MRDKAIGFIAEHTLLKRGDRVIVALSGGADSVALLHLLISVKELYNLTIYAAHLNHQLRGEEAARDERFVRELCEKLSVELFVRREDIGALCKERKESEELVGREERYRFFEELSRERHAKIAVAHTKSDNTETVLMQLTRGAGLKGMSGIPLRRGEIIRPLLCCDRAEIERYCEENGLSFVSDSSNAQQRYARNRVRHSVIPALKTLNANLDENITRFCEIAEDADAYLTKISKIELNNSRTTYGYRCEKLLNLDRIIRRYAVKMILEEARAPYDHCHIGLIEEAMATSGSVNLSGGFFAVCAQGTLRIVRKAAAEPDFCVRLSDYEGAALVQPGEKSEKIHKKFFDNCIPCDIITSDTVVRYRREKDTFTLCDRNVTKTIKKLFNELKIPQERRDRIKLAATGSRVLWIEGIGVSKEAKDAFDENKAFYDMKSNEG